MKKEGITKHEAILKAKEMIGCNGQPVPEQSKAKSKSIELTPEHRTKILSESFTHFVRSLNAKPEKAIRYLESRKLNYKKLSIGYDAGTLHKVTGTTEEQKQAYLHAGLLKPDKFGRENSYYTRFNGCIVFPLLDKSGNITSLYGRHTDQGHHYLEGDHKGLYPGYPGPETTRLILTEAIIDAATLQQQPEITKDFTILALYGTNGFTEEHRVAIAKIEDLKEVVLFFDGDEAGTEAINRLTPELKMINEKLTISYVETPQNEDINSLLQGHEPEIFTHLLDNRRHFSFSIEKPSVEKENNMQSQESSSFFHSFIPSLKITPDYLQYETNHLTITLWGGIEIHTVNRLRATLHIQLKSNEYSSFRDTADQAGSVHGRS